MKKMNKFVIVAMVVFLAIVGTAYAQEGGALSTKDFGLALGAGFAVGLAALGAGIAIGHAGAATIGAIIEKPATSTWGLIIIALGEGVALYGLIIAFLLLGKMS